MKRFNSLACAIASILSTAAIASAPDTEAVEYYNAFTKHYFVTATASESRIIDSGGAGEGWMRTGRSFQAWIAKAAAPADASAVCRFYSSGANSHFYTASAGECEGLKDARSGWQYEGIAFYIHAPSQGQCPAGTVELLRAYNNGFANGEGSNHRFIDDANLNELMVESKWIAEGAVFCATPKSTGTSANLRPTTTSFESLVGTWKGAARWEVETGDNDKEVTQPLELTLAADGSITGTGYGCAFTGKVTLGDGFRSLFTGSITASGCTDTAFNGQYTKIKLQRFGANTLMARMKRGDGKDEASISARLVNDAAAPPPATPASFDGLAGDWVGTVGWEAESSSAQVEVNRPLELSISTAGAITGTGFGCTFTGSLAAPAQVTAAGCENAIFNGTFERIQVRREDGGRIELSFKRESGAAHVEIEGTLQRKETATTPPPAPAADPGVVGKWDGRVSWSAGGASGSDAVTFTIAADGTLTGSGFGCTVAGTLKLALNARAVTSGTVTASGCTRQPLNVTFTKLEFTREDANGLEFQLEREVNGVKVKVKGKVTRVAV